MSDSFYKSKYIKYKNKYTSLLLYAKHLPPAYTTRNKKMEGGSMEGGSMVSQINDDNKTEPTKEIFQIVNFEYYKIEDAIITAGRNCIKENSFGLRPKMNIIFSMPKYINENKENILMTTVAALMDGNEYSFSTVKYNLKSVNDDYSKHPGGQEKFDNESKVWLNLTRENQILASTYQYLDDDVNIEGNGIFSITFYPCSFLLKKGITHGKLFVEIMPDTEIIPGDELCYEIIGSEWNTYDEYIGAFAELEQKLLDLPQVVRKIKQIDTEISLDPSNSKTLDFLQEMRKQ